MIGTACFGPYVYTSTGSNIIDDPVPTTPLTAPAAVPTMAIMTMPQACPAKNPANIRASRFADFLTPLSHLMQREP
ncbi:hypothetical protein THI4931_11620 [Pandoraea sputorum]|nr:hypothetical protein THI4931_11620 [Pandoraea sputorum]